MKKTVLILGANSDVAKECILLYAQKGYNIIAASRNTRSLDEFITENDLQDCTSSRYFDANDYSLHTKFYSELPSLPSIVLYSIGFLVQNEEAFKNFDKCREMMSANYMAAVSILSLIANDEKNTHLERIIGLSSLSGVRGRKSNFVYGSTKAAFTHFLEGLQQQVAHRKIVVNVFVLGYINSKINEGLELNKHLLMEPTYVAKKIVNANRAFLHVPNFKWKIIYNILRILPKPLLAKLP